MAKDPKRVAAGKKSKRKGSSNENKLAKEFKAWWGHGEWARTPSSGGWATPKHREEFRTCGDIITSALDFPWCVEAKKQEKWEIRQLVTNDKCIILEWWQQAVDETPPGLYPMLVIARNRVKPIVVVRVDDFSHFSGVDRGGLQLVSKFPYFHYSLPGKENLLMISLENLFEIDPRYFGCEHNDEEEK